MTLKNWLDNSWLIEHATNSQEISDLLQVADRDLKDCETRGLSADWQLGIRNHHGGIFPDESQPEVARTCPKCGSEMVLRVAKKGAHSGKEFGGCSKFPGYRGVASVEG